MENKTLSILFVNIAHALLQTAHEINGGEILHLKATKAEEPKAEEPKAEEPKAEEPKAEEVDYFKSCQALILGNVKTHKKELFELLQSFGARTLGAVPVEKLPRLYKLLVELVGG